MSQLTLARPYAKAVFETARAENAFAQWTQMLGLAADVARNPKMIALMKNPKISNETVVSWFLEIGKDSFNEHMKNLCVALASFHRLSLLPEIFELYEEMREKAQRVVSVNLTSAYPVDEAFQIRLKQALKQKMNCEIQLECNTDSSILGGAVIRAGDLLIDGSARGRLAKLSEAIGII